MTSEVCVAAIDLKTRSIVRPLRWNHHNWPEALVAQGLQPGRIVRQSIRYKQDSHGFQHETEDTQLTDTLTLLDAVSAEDLYAVLAPFVDPYVRAIFKSQIVDGKYIIDGSMCRSLGSILCDPGAINAVSNDYGQIRLNLIDQSGDAYDLKVTEYALFGKTGSGDSLNDLIAKSRKGSRGGVSTGRLSAGLGWWFSGVRSETVLSASEWRYLCGALTCVS